MVRPGRPKKYDARIVVTFNTEAKLYEKFLETTQREGETKADLYTEFMEQYVKEHGKSNNPQTILTQFDSKEVMAIPNLYESDEQKWDKFMSKVDSKEYELLIRQHTMLADRLNKRGRELK